MSDYRVYAGIVTTPYLVHYGVSKRDGAKVGSGRYPLGSGERPNQWKERGASKSDAKKAQRKLNKLDNEQVRLISDMQKHERRRDKVGVKALRAEQKYGAGSKQHQKYVNKLREEDDKVAISEAALKKSESETWKTIAELNEAGYDISSKKVMKDADMGKRILVQQAFGLVGTLTYMGIHKPNMIEGNKYKVGVPKEGDEASIKFDNRDLTEQRKRDTNVEKKLAYMDYDGASSKEVEKAREKLFEIDRNKNSYKEQVDYDRAMRKATDNLERAYKKEEAQSRQKELKERYNNSEMNNYLNDWWKELSSDMNFRDAKDKQLAKKQFMAEQKYLNIAEDDFTPHDEAWKKMWDAADKELEAANREVKNYHNR